MAIEEFGPIQTFKAARDLSDYYYCPMRISAEDTVDYCGLDGAVIGILQNKPGAAGRAAEVLTANGVKTKLWVDASSTNISVKDDLYANASHHGAKFTMDSDGGTETYMIGRALEASDGDDEFITILTNFSPTARTA